MKNQDQKSDVFFSEVCLPLGESQNASVLRVEDQPKKVNDEQHIKYDVRHCQHHF